MGTAACGRFNTWSQLNPAPKDPNMSTYIMWEPSGTYWQYVSNTANILREYPSTLNQCY